MFSPFTFPQFISIKKIGQIYYCLNQLMVCIIKPIFSIFYIIPNIVAPRFFIIRLIYIFKIRKRAGNPHVHFPISKELIAQHIIKRDDFRTKNRFHYTVQRHPCNAKHPVYVYHK